MAILRQEFPQPPPIAIASYDYADVSENTGIQVFYGLITTDSSGDRYRLSGQALHSTKIEVTTAYSTTNFAGFDKVVDLDFDLTPFALPKKIEGRGYIRFSSLVENDSAVAGDYYVICKLRKWDGSTETEIGSVQSETFELPTNPDVDKTYFMEIPINSVAKFRKGDQMRLTIEFYVSTDGNPGTTSGDITFGVDPQNRDGTLIVPSSDSTGNKTTNLKLWVPFLLDL